MNKQKSKEPKPKERSRFRKDGYQVIKDHKFNLERPPFGFNYLLGYCEQPYLN